jgi:hypothetical protein
MSRFLNLLVACIALSLVLGVTACKKGEEKADDKAGEKAEKAVEKTEEAADENKEAAAAGEENKEAAAEAAGAAISTGVKECDDLIEMYVKCDKLPQQSRDAFLQGADQWKKSIAQGGAQAIKAMTESCVQALASTRQALAAVGC